MYLDGLDRISPEPDFLPNSRIPAPRHPNVRYLPMGEYIREMERRNGLTAGWGLNEWRLLARDRFKDEHPRTYRVVSGLYRLATSVFG